LQLYNANTSFEVEEREKEGRRKFFTGALLAC